MECIHRGCLSNNNYSKGLRGGFFGGVGGGGGGAFFFLECAIVSRKLSLRDISSLSTSLLDFGGTGGGSSTPVGV
jgi:hypothetical protein